jgi:hypothetical protein
MNNHTMAINDFQKAIELDDRSSVAYFYKGTSKLKSNSVSEAIQDFLMSDRLDELQENPGIFDGLG